MTARWACFLQRFSSPWLDEVMYLLTLLGSEGFFVVALSAIYWTWSKRAGYRVAALFLFSTYTNLALKSAFHTSRPVPTLCSRVIHPETGGGYAFPSGHAQGTTVVWGQTAVEVRRPVAWVLAGLAVFVVSLTRIYLNVHWPVDVVGGALIGVTLATMFNLLSGWWERLAPPVWLRVAGCAALPVAMYLLYRGDDARILIGFLAGLPLGRMIEERYVGWSERATLAVNVRKVVAGLAVLLVIGYGLKAALPPSMAWDIARYAAAGLWASLGAPLLFTRLGWRS